MLFAQSSELPPPSPTSESTPAARATAAPASAIAEVGSWSKPEKVRLATPAASSDAVARAAKPAATIPGSATSSVRRKPSSRASSPSARERARPEDEAGRARELERRHGPVGPAPPSASDQSWLRFMMKSAPFAGTAVA